MSRLPMVCLLMLAVAAPAQAADLSRYQAPEVQEAIARITRDAIQARLAGKPYHPPAIPGPLSEPGGAFVTFSGRGATRGCWGTVHPQAPTLAEEIATSAAKALSHDYRQRPIHPRELADLVAHVSIVGPLMPLGSPASLQPRRHGLLVSAPGKGGVLLPGEALTAAWAVATARKKAGLGPRERAGMYRFDTAVVGPIPLKPKE